jgi:hypothetical protein
MTYRGKMEDADVRSIKLSQAAIETLDRLLSSVPPHALRENLLEIYHTYLIHAHHTLPHDFEKLAMNMYLLINCLGTLEREK